MSKKISYFGFFALSLALGTGAAFGGAMASDQDAFAQAVRAGALVEGQYVTFEQKASAGADWLALHKTEKGWELVPTSVRTHPTPSASGSVLMDVSSPLTRVQAMLRNEKLKSGPVATPKLAGGSLQPTFGKTDQGYSDVTFTFASKPHAFKVSTLTSENPTLTFVSGSGPKARMSVIGNAPMASVESAYTVVYWMGDLDRDGRLDLITKSDSAPGVLSLWLSSAAEGSEALKKVN